MSLDVRSASSAVLLCHSTSRTFLTGCRFLIRLRDEHPAFSRDSNKACADVAPMGNAGRIAKRRSRARIGHPLVVEMLPARAGALRRSPKT
jgi:hypothetical protein